MKKLALIFSFILLFVSSGFTQYEQHSILSHSLVKFKKAKDSKVQIGMSPQDIRKALGSPKSIVSGFPNSEDLMLKKFPEMVGQLNNSTWIYFYSPISVEYYSPTVYYVNGQKVDRSDFEAYKNKSRVFLYKGRVISLEMVDGYKFTDKKNLTTTIKDSLTTLFKKEGLYKATVIPVYCVIFDKGTQSVASTVAYFIK